MAMFLYNLASAVTASFLEYPIAYTGQPYLCGRDLPIQGIEGQEVNIIVDPPYIAVYHIGFRSLLFSELKYP